MSDYTKVQISAKTYMGFNVELPNNILVRMSKEDIITEMKQFMKTFFTIHNLEDLKNGIDELNLHIHGDIVIGHTIYVCNHC